MTGYQLLLNAGERVVPAGTASLLVATAPVYASLLAVAVLGERSTRRRWAGSAVALAGTVLIAASHGLGFGASALVVLAAAVLQGVFHTAQKPLLARYTGFEVTAYAMWAGTVFILPWTGSLLRALWGPGAHAGGAAIGSAVFLGLAPSAAGFVLWAYAMARMDVGRVTVSLYLVPAAAIGISLAWLGQVPGPVELIGGVIALAGVMLARDSRVPAGDQHRGHGQRGGRPGERLTDDRSYATGELAALPADPAAAGTTNADATPMCARPRGILSPTFVIPVRFVTGDLCYCASGRQPRRAPETDFHHAGLASTGPYRMNAAFMQAARTT